MDKSRVRLLLILICSAIMNGYLYANHYMGGQLSYETIDLDSQRGVYSITMRLERPCSVYNTFNNEYPIKVLEYSSNMGYILSVYTAKLVDSSYIYFPCSSSSANCASYNTQIIEVKLYKVNIVVQNTNKECTVFFDNNATRTYSDNLYNPNDPLVLFTSFIPSYNNSQYRFYEIKRHFPLKNNTANILYESTDLNNDSIAVVSSMPIAGVNYSLGGGNANFNYIKSIPKIGLSDVKPFYIIDSIKIAHDTIRFTPFTVQNSWLSLIKTEFRKINTGTKDTWIQIGKSNSERLFSVYDISSIFQLQSISSPASNVTIAGNSIIICNSGDSSTLLFKFPIEKNTLPSQTNISLNGLSLDFNLSSSRIIGSVYDTMLYVLKYLNSTTTDINSKFIFSFNLCNSTTGVGFDKTIEIPVIVFNYKIFALDTILSCTNTISIPTLTDKLLNINFGSYNSSQKSVYIANPTDTLIIASLVNYNEYCPISDSIYLNHGSVFSLTSIGYPPSCYGYQDASAKVIVNGTNTPYTFYWSNNSTYDSIGSLNAGMHIVEVMDKDHCKQSDTIIIPEAQGIISEWIVDTGITCYGGNDGRGHFQITSSLKPNSYQWDDNIFWIDSFRNQLNSQIYTGIFSYTNSSGTLCQQDFSIQIPDPDTMFLDIITTDNTCFGDTNGKIAVIAHGGYGNYQFFIDNSLYTSGFKYNLGNSTVSVFVKDDKGCVTSLYHATVSSPSQLEFTPSITSPSCKESKNGRMIISSSIGGVSPYQYSFNSNAYGETTSFSNLDEGNYQISIRDANQCELKKNFTLGHQYSLQASLNELIHSKCPLSNTGIIKLNMNNGLKPYKIFINSDSQLYYIPNIYLDRLKPYNYTIRIIDSNNCAWQGNYQINEPDSIKISTLLKGESCFGKKDGSIHVQSIKGGTPPYQSLQWYNSHNDLLPNVDKLLPGNYKLKFIDNIGCEYESAYNISAKSEFKVQIDVLNSLSCHGDTNGIIKAITTGGAPPLKFSWKNYPLNSSEKLSQVGVGTYLVEVSDMDNCIAFDSFVNTQPPPIILDELKIKNTDCPHSKNGIITLVCSGYQDLQYRLNSQSSYSSSNTFTDLEEGNYEITVKNTSNCEKKFNAEIKTDKSLEVRLFDTIKFGIGDVDKISPDIVYGLNTRIMDISNIIWTPPSSLNCTDCLSPYFTALKSDVYQVSITYGRGCKTSAFSYFDVSKPKEIFIPNSFSPNGDNKNDEWFVYGKNIMLIDIRLFNRVGEMVFFSKDINHSWDGRYKGELEHTGVYSYLIKTTYADGSEKIYEGSLNLFR